MKRTVIATIAAATLLAATPASAGKQSWRGHLDAGGTIKFTVKTKKNDHRVVRGLVFTGAQANCKGGQELFENPGLPIGPLPVKSNDFHGKQAVDPHGTVRVAGHLTNHHSQAYGKIKLSGDIAGNKNCFGKNRWHAARG